MITVRDQANEACPVFYGARERVHRSFPDPSKAHENEEQQLKVYCQVRDAIRERIETTPDRARGSRFIRRGAQGRFTSDQVDAGRAQAPDRRQNAKQRAHRPERPRRLARVVNVYRRSEDSG